jgi:hypothetical protein
MVKLHFTVPVAASLDKVWAEFSRFEAVPDWDPNTVSCKPIRKTPEEIGSVYEVEAMFAGSQSKVTYTTTKYVPKEMVQWVGGNDKINAIDEISFKPIDANTTWLTYQANITLKGFKWLFTPFAMPGLIKLQEDGKKGMIERTEKLFGKVPPK